MEYRYYINQSDEKEAKELLASKNIEIIREEEGKRNETNRAFLLIPLQEEKTVVYVLNQEVNDSPFHAVNGNRRAYLEKWKKRSRLSKKQTSWHCLPHCP